MIDDLLHVRTMGVTTVRATATAAMLDEAARLLMDDVIITMDMTPGLLAQTINS